MGWTAADIPDLTGRCAIVTGGNGGLGLSISRALAAHGAQVVIAARNAEKAKAAAERIATETPAAQVEIASLDLSDLDSVRSFAGDWSDRSLHLLVNNAGVMAIPLARTKAGFEMQFGTNHLGHFALTGLLLPALIRSGAGRVVTMSSTAHKTGKIRFDDLQFEQRYGKFAAYGQSKLANLLFMRELNRRLTAAGVPVISVAAHPGYAATELQTLGPKMAGNRLVERIVDVGNRVFAQSADDGALPALYAATMPDVHGGEFFGPGGFMEMRGAPKQVGMTRAAGNDDDARRLWTVSESLTGVTYEGLAAVG
jgi:NAD(P)-dependent dehydrogenase (short-subunit alcohol dehydrogenase family)